MTSKHINILLAEDDESLGYLLKSNLESENYAVTLCADGAEAAECFVSSSFDLCIFDIMMPVKDGLSLAKQVRRINDRIPIIFLTSKAQEADKIKAFTIGADDYVTKPFSIKELQLRIRSVLRRTMPHVSADDASYSFGHCRFDYPQRALWYRQDKKILSAREADILKLLIDHKNTVVLRTKILTDVWGSDDFFNSKSLDVYLTRLRRLLKQDTSVSLQNLYGTGYKLVVAD